MLTVLSLASLFLYLLTYYHLSAVRELSPAVERSSQCLLLSFHVLATENGFLVGVGAGGCTTDL